MGTKNQLIYFKVLEEKPKTKVYGVYSKKSKELLGKIFWWGSWRQYVFMPKSNNNIETIWSINCLQDVRNFMEDLMEAKNDKLQMH